MENIRFVEIQFNETDLTVTTVSLYAEQVIVERKPFSAYPEIVKPILDSGGYVSPFCCWLKTIENGVVSYVFNQMSVPVLANVLYFYP